MNEVNVVNENRELLNELSELLIDESNSLNDISETLLSMGLPQTRTLEKAVQEVGSKLIEGNLWILEMYFEKDERNEHLDNLKGYFNENTGTWYEQICSNFKALTGFPANKWSALTWTIHLSLGHSTFDYLVGHKYIYVDRKGKAIVDNLKDSERFGYDVERIQHLIDTDFRELKAVTAND
ncbi:hypothetical protein [Enterococcus avium]|uniref:hypothetical protein n=1 Tax=Enterococcus avium TaxID=33945 RepID=UPI001C0FD9B3|nr:hypothetical protein [Enterococcus avium]MBU5369600.1 hypothetical protein [Enterococcus avium]MDT2422085.1 hypothetical protein [Enterococcus avium]